MKRVIILSLAAAVIVFSILPAFADYTIFLKNGRKFITQSFREEGGMIKFYSYSGEISLRKDQIQAIRPAGDAKPPKEEPFRSAPATVTHHKMPDLERRDRPQVVEDNAVTKEIEIQSVKQENAYKQRIKKIDNQLKELRAQYATETRGNTGVDPIFFTTEEAFKGHQEDLLSRLRDAQYKAQGLPSGGDAQSPPFSTNPPPAYTEKQKLLSDLRKQITELESEREHVIAEMKRNHMDTGSLSSE